MNGAGRKAHGLKDRTLLRTDGVHHSDAGLLDEVPIREWVHPASKDEGNIITGTHYLVGLSSLLAEERSCFLQVAWQSIDGVFPLRRRHRPEVWCSMLCLPVASHVTLFKNGLSLQAYEALGCPKRSIKKYFPSTLDWRPDARCQLFSS